MNRTQAIIFDFDGVILDSVSIKTEAFAELYAPYGDEIRHRVVTYHHAHGGISRYEKFTHWERELLGKNPTDEDIELLARRFSDLVFQKVLAAAFLPGAEDFLEKFSDKMPLFVCTGTPDPEIQRVVAERNLRPYFREVVGSPTRKPAIIQYLLKKYSLNPDHTLFVGDAMTDYHAAQETGLRFIGMRSEHTEFPVGTEVVGDFWELVDYLDHGLARILH